MIAFSDHLFLACLSLEISFLALIRENTINYALIEVQCSRGTLHSIITLYIPFIDASINIEATIPARHKNRREFIVIIAKINYLHWLTIFNYL